MGSVAVLFFPLACAAIMRWFPSYVARIPLSCPLWKIYSLSFLDFIANYYFCIVNHILPLCLKVGSWRGEFEPAQKQVYTCFLFVMDLQALLYTVRDVRLKACTDLHIQFAGLRIRDKLNRTHTF